MVNLLKVLFSAIKAKIVPLWTRFKLFTNKTFLQSRVITVIRKFFVKIFNVKPRDKKDYFTFRRWMVSRRLCYAITLALGILSLYFIFVIAKPFGSKSGSSDGYKVYKYNSQLLKLQDGNVKIKAKGGYIAYVGAVKKGYCEGEGSLYNKSGSLVYQGNFSESKYSGKGTLYYASGQAKYIGEFENNLFNGEGTYYRSNGSKEYVGEFVNGKKQGTGSLCDTGNNTVFTGLFSNDSLVYSQILGKKPSEISSDMYFGSNVIYTYGDQNFIHMADINAMYVNSNSDTSIEEEGNIELMYVLDDSFTYGENVITDIESLTATFGQPDFQGNSYLTVADALAVHLLEESGSDKLGNYSSSLEHEALYDEYQEITSYNASQETYIYRYNVDGITYEFYFTSKYGDLFMYSMADYQ